MKEKLPMRVLVTGSNGFIGKNLVIRLNERAGTEVLSFARGDSFEVLAARVSQADAIVHLAGENLTTDISNFALVNTDLTRYLCESIRANGRNIPLILASSTQTELDNPNYNSVVATFCHNIARGLPIQINDAKSTVQLVYVEDVVDNFLSSLDEPQTGLDRAEIPQRYAITLGELAEQISAFHNCRTSLISERVGTGLTRALYSTYISYLPPDQFAYDLPQYGDERGIFVEMLKTPDCGQFSFFTVYPTVTRGSHYHHTKTEKFLVLSGVARMCFRQMVTGETYEVAVSGEKPQVVDSIPGWVHDITNVGDSEVVVMLWANEIFDHQRPDCIPCEV